VIEWSPVRQAEQDPNPPSRGLGPDVGAPGVSLVDELEDVAVEIVEQERVGEPEGNRST